MRILLHDHAGHPFQAELARELARRGHRVHHVHCATFVSAKGALERRIDDPRSLTFGSIAHRRPFAKYRWFARALQELEYGVRARRLMNGWRPDIVVSCNTPLLSQALLSAGTRRRRPPSVAWVQDIYSAAAHDVLASRLGRFGTGLARVVASIEASVLRRSDRVVAISEGFVVQLRAWGVPQSRIAVIRNWAPLSELPRLEHPTQWGCRHGLERDDVVMYTGILGLKHDPSLLAELAEHVEGRAIVAVVAAGPGRDWLLEEMTTRGLSNLRLLDFQPHAVYPEVLATAAVLVALLTDESGRYSVPSKVLSYLCAGRPIVAAIPPDNDVADTIEHSGAGFVFPPGERSNLFAAIDRLLEDGSLREQLGSAGRRYAEQEFDIVDRADRFEAVLADAAECRPNR